MATYSPVSAIWLLFIMLMPGSTPVGRISIEELCQRKTQVMSADVYVHLFNMRTYEEKVLPAYRAFLNNNDARLLLALLKDCIQRVEASPELSTQLLWDRESLEEDISIVTGTVYYSPDDGQSSNQGESEKAIKVRQEYARGILSAKIVEILCVAYDKGMSAEQDMTNSPLVPYLYKKSGWIKDLFTFVRKVRGNRLEFSIGESSEVFTQQDLQEFDLELDRVGQPQDMRLRTQFDNLLALVKMARRNSDLRLTLSIK